MYEKVGKPYTVQFFSKQYTGNLDQISSQVSSVIEANEMFISPNTDLEILLNKIKLAKYLFWHVLHWHTNKDLYGILI